MLDFQSQKGVSQKNRDMEERRERKKGAEEAGGKDGRRESQGGREGKQQDGEEETASINMCFKVHQLRLVFRLAPITLNSTSIYGVHTIGKAS